MPPSDQPPDYYAGLNHHLLRAVPTDALRLLDVGCGEGRLGEALKRLDPRRAVFGAECQPAAAARAATRLDRAFCLDVEADDVPLEPGSLDCLLYGDVLEHLRDPEAALRRHRPLLRPGGVALACVPNVGHHSVLADLLRGEFQYAGAGLLDLTHLRFFTWAAALKLFLDAGYAPSLHDAISVPCPDALAEALGPACRLLGLHPGRARHHLGAYQYVVRAAPLAEEPVGGGEPMTFVACVSDEARLRANLLASPGLRGGPAHEVLLFRGCASAAEGLNRGAAAARHPLVVCLHQDVYLPRGWPARFLRRYREAERALGPVGVAGVYGVSLAGGRVVRAGHVVDRERLLREPAALPAAVQTLDELLLAVPRGTPLRFDERLGFHLYGADVALQARQRGLAAVAVDAPCLHNSLAVDLPPEFVASAGHFAAKWAARLPVATPCVLIEGEGRMSVS